VDWFFRRSSAAAQRATLLLATKAEASYGPGEPAGKAEGVVDDLAMRPKSSIRRRAHFRFDGSDTGALASGSPPNRP
jgi:hypothetical protein